MPKASMFQTILISLFILIIPLISSADWVTQGVYSEKAGIDSLERLLVIHDYRDSTFLGDGIIPLGDINGDNYSDILICRGRRGYSWADDSCFLYYGGNPPDEIPDRIFGNFTKLTYNIGDINGDGYDDLARSDGLVQEIYIYYGGPDMDDIPDFTFTGVWAYVGKPGDIDDDGVLDLVLTQDVNGGDVYIYKLGSDMDDIPDYIISNQTTGFGHRAVLIDYNGDGYKDLAVSSYYNHDSYGIQFYWGGPDFDSNQNFEIPGSGSAFGEFLMPVGDFNGDGYEDLYIGGNSPQPYGIFLGGPDYDGELDIVTNKSRYGGYFVQTSVDIAGDINSDGYLDLIIGVYSDWFDSEIYGYLGGPDADSVADIMLDEDEMPEPESCLGWTVSGIGDFNGDGIDDFASRTQTEPFILWNSRVHIFSGWDNSTVDVPYDYEPTIPNSFKLYQNYPNPFNPTTTISFEIPYKTHAALTIHNILGQEVAQLIDKDLPAGTYNVKWNGTDNSNKPLASGVYLYRLATDEAMYSKKMILMK